MTRLFLCLLLALCLSPAAPARSHRRAAPGRVYKGAIVVEAGTGAVLFADHADEVSPPASLTKLMTFAVLEDVIRSGRLSLQTPVTVSAEDAAALAHISPSSVGLKRGETFPVEELIYAMMIHSANDAAYVLARAAGGSVPAFIEAMNAKARQLGMDRTVFRTPNGLPVRSHRIADGDLTTPRDYALLCRYLVNRTQVLKYTSVKSRLFGAGRRFPPTPMTNHNHLLGKIAGVDGLKTGFTNGAGFCLAATAHRGGRRVIVIVMDCPDSRDRDLAVAQLIESGLALRPFIKPTITPAADGTSGSEGDSNPTIRFTVPPPGEE